MSNNIIVYQDSTGLHLSTPAECADMESLISRTVPKDSNGEYLPYKIMSRDELPITKYIYSWSLIDSSLVQDRSELYELKKAEWRGMRSRLLIKYDIAFIKALEAGNALEQQKIINIKKKLRDVTATKIDFLSNEELEDFVPEILNVV